MKLGETEETMALNRWHTRRHPDGESSYLYPYQKTKRSYKFFRFTTDNTSGFGQFGKAAGIQWRECETRYHWAIKATFGNLR